MATREEVLAELNRRGTLKDPSKAPLVAEMRRRGLLPQEPEPATPPTAEKQGLLSRGYDLLNKPSEMSRQGLTQIAESLPQGGDSGNMLKDVAVGTPRVVAETLSEMAPSFIDAPAILTGGAAKVAGPVLRTVGKGMAKAASRLSGAEAEGLEAVAKDPSLLFTKGKKAVEKLFQAAKQETPLAATAKTPKAYINRAEDLAKRNLLTPSEAHEARKEVDRLFGKGTITGERQRALRDTFDKIVKTDPQLAEADTAFRRLKQVESVRELVPSSGVGRLLAAGAGGASLLNPIVAATLPMFSPLIQGGGAAIAGGLGRVLSSPRAAVAGKALIDALTRKDKKQ